MSKQRYIVPVLLGAVAIIALSLLMYRYQFSTNSISIQENDFTAQLSVEPSTMMIPQEIHLAWEVGGINAIYLNDVGVTGVENRTFAAYCQTYEFDIILRDSSTQNYTLSAFILIEPVNVILIFIVLCCALSAVAAVALPINQVIASRFSELVDIQKHDYWDQNGLFWLRILLLSMILVTVPMMLSPSCMNKGQNTELVMAIVALNALLAFVALLISIVKPTILRSATKFLSQYVPYPITVVIVFAYWGFCYTINIGFHGIVQWQFALVVHLLGVFILATIQNRQVKQVSLDFSASFKRYSAVGLVLIIWLMLYFAPWASLFNNYFLQTLIGLGLFIIPGILMTVILTPDGISWTRLITLGFALSMFLASIISIVAIVLGLSASIFKLIFATTGMLAILYILLSRKIIVLKFMSDTSLSLYETIFFSFSILAVLILMIRCANPDPRFDFVTYNAMVTEFAHSTRFSLQDPFLGTNNVMQHRLWLMAWPVSQALIVNFSNLNILQVISDLNVLLVVFVAMAIYDLMRKLKMPREFAMLALIFTAFAIVSEAAPDQIGWIFQQRLVHDKILVAWVLTPILLTSVYDFLRYGGKRYGFLTLLIAFTIVNTHATSFVYAGMLVGIVACLYFLFQYDSWKRIVVIVTILAGCAIIPLILRELSTNTFVLNTTEMEPTNWRLVRLAITSDFVLLGINPELRNGLSFAIVYATTLIALLNIKKEPLAYYIIAGCIVILSVSNPITAPLIAKIVTVSHLWRATWFVPFGAAGAFCVWILFRYSSSLSTRFSKLFVLIVAVILILHAAANPHIEPREPYYKLDDLVEITTSIASVSPDKPIIIIANSEIQDLIPSLLWNAHTIIWRSDVYRQTGISEDDWRTRVRDNRRVFRPESSVSDLNELIDTYNVKYIILDETSDFHLQELINENSQITRDQMNGSFVLYAFNEHLP